MARQRAQERGVKGRIYGHVPTEESRALVEEWAGYGAPPEVIARKLDLSPQTLTKHYADELLMGNPRLVVELAQRGRDVALGLATSTPGQSSVLIYMLKALGGTAWADTPHAKQLSKGEEAALSRPAMPVFLPDNGRAPAPIIDGTKAKPKQIAR